MVRTSPLQRAVEIAGGQSALAKAIGVKQAHIWHWLNRAKQVPAQHAIAIEKATGGKVKRHELRPDVYPIEEPCSGEHAEASEEPADSHRTGTLG